MRLLCAINSLEGGGAERVFAQVSQALADAFGAGSVEIALLDAAPEAYLTPEPIAKHTLSAQGRWRASVTRLVALSRARKPDLILSFLARANCCAIAAGYAVGAATIISERVHTKGHFGPRLASGMMVRALYPLAHRVVAVSQGVAAGLARSYGVAGGRLRVIHNPVDLAAIRQAGAATPQLLPPRPFYVAVGRLAPSKNMGLLISAFARARPQADLVILGEGPERPALQAQARRLGVAERVFLPGFLANPHAVMARARAYVSTSNVEGFPNALAEAMALSLPVVSTDCPAGPAEILGAERPVTRLTAEPYGLLAPVQDEDAIASALLRLESPSERARLARAARARAEHFAAGPLLSRWVALVDEVLRTRGARCGSA